jgi:hypothetical protein
MRTGIVPVLAFLLCSAAPVAARSASGVAVTHM